jgi:hypothetical protein
MEKYKAQLDQVNFLLANNPDNEQLLILKNKLNQILELKLKNDDDFNSFRQIKKYPLDFPLQVGEACEILDEKEKYWKPGNIISMTLDREFCIVRLVKADTAYRVPSLHVRRPLHSESKVSTKPGSKMVVLKPRSFKPRKVQAEPDGPNEWKKFAEKMIKK